MDEQVGKSGSRLEDTSLVFDDETGSVFDVEPFIADVELTAGDTPHPAPAPEPGDGPDRSWQAAVGRRMLTPQEQAARERYFDAKAAEAVARSKRGSSSAA